MIYKNRKGLAAICVAIAFALCACNRTRNESLSGGNAVNDGNTAQSNTAVDLSALSNAPEYPENAVEGSCADSVDARITLNSTDIEISGSGAKAEGGVLTITASGSYLLSGELADGQIVVDTADEEKVTLYLNGVKVSNLLGCAVNIISAPKKVVLYSCENSVNIFSDGDSYYTAEDAANDADIPNAAVYSKDDLEFDGMGEIYVTSNCAKGINCKDDLEFVGGTLYVTSVDDAVRGKDSLTVANAMLNLYAIGDGLRTSNETEEGMGNMMITDSVVEICAQLDGIQSVGALDIQNSEISVLSGGGYTNAQAHDEDFFGGGHFGGGDFGGGGHFDGGNRGDRGDMPPMQPGGNGYGVPMSYATQEQTDTQTETVSTKGIKSARDMNISGGNISVDSADDSIHTNACCAINGAKISLSAGDDAIHADNTIDINSGEVSVATSYEGLESAYINISGGYVYIKADDDGLNATDGTSSEGGFGGVGGGFGAAQSVEINITGGTTIVDANGDGIDSNGTVVMNDGLLVVFGPTSGGNGALDYQSAFALNGGTMLAVGSSQMAMSVSDSEYGVLYFNTSIPADTIMQIADENGNEIFCFASPKNYTNLVFTSLELASGKSYTVSVGGTYSTESANGIYSGGNYEGAETSESITAS